MRAVHILILTCCRFRVGQSLSDGDDNIRKMLTSYEQTGIRSLDRHSGTPPPFQTVKKSQKCGNETSPTNSSQAVSRAPTSYSSYIQTLAFLVEYRGLPDGLERDIFQRVQLGIPLTAAEKLQAHSSPWAQYISHLTSSFINSDTGLTNHIELDTSRGRDFQAIAQMVFCCDGLPEQRFPTAHKLDVWLQQTEPPKKAFKDAVKECLRVFRFVASTPGYDVGFKEVKNRVAPAEFVFIG